MSDLHTEAVLDSAHLGGIRGGSGTILRADTGPHAGIVGRIRTVLYILGPGPVVKVGDNDAGAFSAYSQAGQTTEPRYYGRWPC